MSIESDFFARKRPDYNRIEGYGFQKIKDGRHGTDCYQYSEVFMDGQFRADMILDGDGRIHGTVIDLETGEEYLPLRVVDQIGEFVGTVRENYAALLGRMSDACFVPVNSTNGRAVRSGAWMIPSNPKIYNVDKGFAAGGGEIEWHQHNDIRPGDEVYIYSSAPNSAILYRCEVVASNLPYKGMFQDSKGYTRSMRIRLIEKYPPDRFPLSFIKANGGSVVRSARTMPAELLNAIRAK